MRRRDFIVLAGGAAAAWPLAARAQQSNKPIIGYFSGRSPDSEEQYRAAILQGLANAGYIDGQDFKVEYRFSYGQDDRLPAIAAELVGRHAAVLVATDTPSAVAAKAASTVTPIVFSSGGDPVKLDLVESVNRPGGNATGVFVFVTELGPKRLQLIREVVPQSRMIAFVVNLSTASGRPQAQAVQELADATGQKILIVNASTESQIDEAFGTLVERRAEAIVYGSTVFFQVWREKLVSLAARHAIPAMYEWPEFVQSGGLMSYSSSRLEAGRQIGHYVGQILQGAKPADLPVIQSSKFVLAINLKTAKALGLSMPPSLLATADEVIE